MGLFAKRVIRKGTPVVWIPKSSVRPIYYQEGTDAEALEDRLTNEGRPHDCIFHLQRAAKDTVIAVYDSELNLPCTKQNLVATKSYWYALNHSSRRANLSPKYVSTEKTVIFTACKDIGVDEELLFHYGKPMDDWDD